MTRESELYSTEESCHVARLWWGNEKSKFGGRGFVKWIQDFRRGSVTTIFLTVDDQFDEVFLVVEDRLMISTRGVRNEYREGW